MTSNERKFQRGIDIRQTARYLALSPRYHSLVGTRYYLLLGHSNYVSQSSSVSPRPTCQDVDTSQSQTWSPSRAPNLFQHCRLRRWQRDATSQVPLATGDGQGQVVRRLHQLVPPYEAAPHYHGPLPWNQREHGTMSSYSVSYLTEMFLITIGFLYVYPGLFWVKLTCGIWMLNEGSKQEWTVEVLNVLFMTSSKEPEAHWEETDSNPVQIIEKYAQYSNPVPLGHVAVVLPFAPSTLFTFTFACGSN